MMEHTTDRLFWTLSAIIIAALLLTLGVKIFPKATQEVIAPMSGLVQSADKSTSAVDQAISGANADKLDWQTGTNGGIGNVSSGSDDTARDQAINNQITKQNQALQSYQGQLNDAVNHINDLNSRLVSLQNDKTGANNSKDISDLKSQISGYNTQVTNYQSQISALNNQITQLKNSQQTTASNGAANGQSINDLQKSNANMTTLITNLQNQLQSTKQNQTNDESLITNLQNQLGGLSSQVQQSINNTATQISSITQQLQAVQAAGGNNASQIQTLTSQLQNLATQYQNISNLVNNQGASITQLQNDDVYKLSWLNPSSNLAKLKTAGSYAYTPGWGGAPRIDQLPGAGNLAALAQTITGFDQGYSTIIVSPQLGTWQTQTLIGANGITLIRSMNNGQDFDSSIDPRCQWHVMSGTDVNTMMYKGDVTNQDLNQWFQTGIYKVNGPTTNGPTPDYVGSLIVVNDGSNSTQELNTLDSNSPNQTERWFRRASNGQWSGWQRADGGTEYASLGGGSSLLDPATFNWPDGMYKVNGVSRDTPWNVSNRYGILIKHQSYPDISLTYYDAWWNGIYVNYYAGGHWQGWREATN